MKLTHIYTWTPEGGDEQIFVPTGIGNTYIRGIVIVPANRVAPLAKRVRFLLPLMADWQRHEVEG